MDALGKKQLRFHEGILLIENIIRRLDVPDEYIEEIDDESIGHTTALIKRVHEFRNDKDVEFSRKLLFAISYMKSTIMKEVDLSIKQYAEMFGWHLPEGVDSE